MELRHLGIHRHRLRTEKRFRSPASMVDAVAIRLVSVGLNVAVIPQQSVFDGRKDVA